MFLKSGSLSVVGHVFDKLPNLHPPHRGDSEPFLNCEPGFHAQLRKRNALGESVQLTYAMALLRLLANANAEGSELLSIFAAAAPNDSMLSPRSSLNDFVKTLKYDTAATVLRKFNEKMPARAKLANKTSIMTPAPSKDSGNRNSSRPRRVTCDDVRAAKDTRSCRKCKQSGHWVSGHVPGGTLSHSDPSSNTFLDPACIELPE